MTLICNILFLQSGGKNSTAKSKGGGKNRYNVFMYLVWHRLCLDLLTGSPDLSLSKGGSGKVVIQFVVPCE